MFQTNEGPSFPAHQFLLSGTSAPVPPGTDTYLDFAAENGGDSYHSGCTDKKNAPPLADPTGWPLLPGPLECYEHQTLVDLLDNHQPKISWRWYTPTPGMIWTAVNAIQHLCYPLKDGKCNSTDWNNNVIWPGKNSAYPVSAAIPFLTDVDSCKLAAVSWVIPDEDWSDHPKTATTGLGPSYVANLVNAIGQKNCPGENYWQDTAIFITWDDWGGFYDHVPPPAAYRENQPGQGFTDCPDPKTRWGCGYTYGYRVPLLVVSAYTGVLNPDGITYSGYVSGDTRTQGGGYQKKYTHDFGSILAFIENNFILGFIYPQTNYYADFNAIDSVNGNIPLSDFFPIPASSPRTFVPIQPVTGYDKNYFQNYYTTPQNGVTPQPQGPDGDDAD